MADEPKPTPPLARPSEGAFSSVPYDFRVGKRLTKHSPNYKRDEVAKHTDFNPHDPQED